MTLSDNEKKKTLNFLGDGLRRSLETVHAAIGKDTSPEGMKADMTEMLRKDFKFTLPPPRARIDEMLAENKKLALVLSTTLHRWNEKAVNSRQFTSADVSDEHFALVTRQVRANEARAASEKLGVILADMLTEGDKGTAFFGEERKMGHEGIRRLRHHYGGSNTNHLDATMHKFQGARFAEDASEPLNLAAYGRDLAALAHELVKMAPDNRRVRNECSPDEVLRRLLSPTVGIGRVSELKMLATTVEADVRALRQVGPTALTQFTYLGDRNDFFATGPAVGGEGDSECSGSVTSAVVVPDAGGAAAGDASSARRGTWALYEAVLAEIVRHSSYGAVGETVRTYHTGRGRATDTRRDRVSELVQEVRALRARIDGQAAHREGDRGSVLRTRGGDPIICLFRGCDANHRVHDHIKGLLGARATYADLTPKLWRLLGQGILEVGFRGITGDDYVTALDELAGQGFGRRPGRSRSPYKDAWENARDDVVRWRTTQDGGGTGSRIALATTIRSDRYATRDERVSRRYPLGSQ